MCIVCLYDLCRWLIIATRTTSQVLSSVVYSNLICACAYLCLCKSLKLKLTTITKVKTYMRKDECAQLPSIVQRCSTICFNSIATRFKFEPLYVLYIYFPGILSGIFVKSFTFCSLISSHQNRKCRYYAEIRIIAAIRKAIYI